LAIIWPFFNFQVLAFLKLFMAKFGLFNFFGPGNPGKKREKIKKIKDKKGGELLGLCGSSSVAM
jgi:hypothetical protein